MAMTGLQPLEEGVKIALDALHAHKLRSSLTILGVAIGVSVVMTMAAFITGRSRRRVPITSASCRSISPRPA